ncbi:MAG: molybdate ABC transporter substrate-binding protein [Polyangiaceae bacterium]
MSLSAPALTRALPFVVALSSSLSCRAQPKEVRVAAASDLKDAFSDLGARFERKTGTKLSFTFGSTGLLTKQLTEGAPYDLFAAASESYVDEVVKAGVCDVDTKAPYARGKLAIWTKDGGVASLADLADPRFKRVAIANPEHAPYGRAAEQALKASGVWGAVSSRIVKGENVQATLALATGGNAEAALVAYSLVVHLGAGAYVLVDAAAHDPIDQALVVCGTGPGVPGARAFAAFIASEEGQEVMRTYGFTLPPPGQP